MNSKLSSALDRIVRSHLMRYPLIEQQDLYKLVYQAAMGSSHAVSDRHRAWQLLQKEAGASGKNMSEPLVETISPDMGICRIHVRPYVRMGYDPRSLLEAFIRTAEEFRGSRETLEDYCMHLRSMEKRGQLPGMGKGISEYLDELREDGYPAVHHSEAYRSSYLPCYRVVAYACLGAMSINPEEARNPARH